MDKIVIFGKEFFTGGSSVLVKSNQGFIDVTIYETCTIIRDKQGIYRLWSVNGEPADPITKTLVIQTLKIDDVEPFILSEFTVPEIRIDDATDKRLQDILNEESPLQEFHPRSREEDNPKREGQNPGR